MINTIQHPCGIERKQSLTSNPQARASCVQAAGAWLLAALALDLACAAQRRPPFALAAGGRLRQHLNKHRP